MKLEFISEPLLDFGISTHLDIRYGLQQYHPFDVSEERRPAVFSVGLIGTAESTEGVARWMEKCRQPIAAKESAKFNLFPAFPGFNEDVCFKARFVIDSSHVQTINPAKFTALKSIENRNKRVETAVELFTAELEILKEKSVAVIVVAMPIELIEALAAVQSPDDAPNLEEEDETDTDPSKYDFHDLLKARAMRYQKPVQVIRPSTYDEAKKRKEKDDHSQGRKLQDEATRAWNFCTALYYKAGGYPWRLPRKESDLSTCFVGVSFFQTLQKDRLLTSVAQVFNERGAGVVVRGGSAERSKEDLQIHLQSDTAQQLLENALQRYKREHKNLPARVVIHKSSGFSAQESTGFAAAIEALGIDSHDFIHVTASFNRLFRSGYYPPLRGTMVSLDQKRTILYTRGSVQFFEEYPGMYVPKTLLLTQAQSSSSARQIASEVLGLTKMNWNNTEFDNLNPITMRAARQVGSIMKYCGEHDPLEQNYRFFM